jgi:Carboxypeptidase regulatory-like domain
MIKMDKTLERLYVASPCSADWDAMPGNNQVRFCNQCQLNVYNISAMTRKQAEELILQSEGRLCTKLYRRSDGAIMTRDCPFGLVVVKRRIRRAASAALGAILGFFSHQTILFAEDGHKNCKHFTANIERLQLDKNTAMIQGTVADENTAVIIESSVTIINEETKRESRVKTDSEGKYRVSPIQAGTYTIIIESPGFSRFKKEKFKVGNGEILQLNVTLQVGTMGGAAFLPETPERNNGKNSMVIKRA